ncbi:hypothetical protein OSTOST_00086, partial [Ostertagia ostertagi]
MLEVITPERNATRLLKPRKSIGEPKRAQGLKQNTRMLIVVIVLFLVTEIPAALIFMTHVLSVSLKSHVINYKLLNILLIVRWVMLFTESLFTGRLKGLSLLKNHEN